MQAAPAHRLQARLAAGLLPPLPLSAIGLAAIAALVCVQAARGFTDPDFWWHLKAGELIVTQHAVPRVDPFTFTYAGGPWIAHEWLAEALIYLLVRAGGYGLALVAFTLSPLAALLLVYRQCRAIGAPTRLALPLTSLTALMIAPYTTVRPQVLSWLFFAALFAALAEFRAGRIRRLWWLPGLFVLWANIHLSFDIGLALLGLFVTSSACERILLHRPVSLLQPLLLLATSCPAACLNPYGPRLLLVPLQYLPLQQEVIVPLRLAEWLPPDFHQLVFAPLLAALLLLLTTGIVPRRLDLWRLGLELATAALALLAVRYIPIFAVAFAPLAGVAICDRWPQPATSGLRRGSTAPQAVHWLLLSLLLAAAAAGMRPGPASQLRRIPSPSPVQMPVQAVDFIEHQAPGARIFNQYDWGGYLIYRLWPGSRPFIDGRAEMFSPQILRDYVSIYNVQPGWERLLDQYGVTLVIVRKNSALAGALEVTPRWHLASSDQLADVYIRDPGQNGP
jgi:hypothetical protein